MKKLKDLNWLDVFTLFNDTKYYVVSNVVKDGKVQCYDQNNNFYYFDTEILVNERKDVIFIPI